MNTYSDIVLKLMALEQSLRDQMKPTSMYNTEINGDNYKQNKLSTETYRYHQDITIADTKLFNKCTSAEWHLIGRVTKDLKMNNLLWYCDPKLKKSSSFNIALKGLITKGILIKTDTTNFYLINPIELRRGDPVMCVRCTTQAIHNNKGIDQSIITNKMPIRQFQFNSVDNQPLQNNQITYGYAEDNQD